MRLPDGRESIATLEYPLSVSLAAALMKAIAKTCEEHGFTDVVILTDGSNRIAATPPSRAVERSG